MESNPRDAIIQPPGPAPFVLLAGAAMADHDLEAVTRRMGLQPEVMPSGGLPLRLTLGAARAVIDRADATTLDFADPADRRTSSLGASLPPGWRDAGGHWTIALEMPDNGAAGMATPQIAFFFRMLVLLIDAVDAGHIFWSPARLWTDARQFRVAIAEMQKSGMPPVLHLVAFRRRDDGGGDHVTTRGLAAFAGQELDARVPAGWDLAAMVKRLARLALDIMLNGPVARAQQSPGLEAGEWVTLTPSRSDGGPATLSVRFSVDR